MRYPSISRAGPDALYVGDDERPSEAPAASHAETAAITSIEDLQVRLPGPQADSLDATEQDTAGYVHRSVLRAYGTARDLSRDHTVKRAGNPLYPATKLGTQLEVVSQIIKSGAATRVYFVPGSAGHARSTRNFPGTSHCSLNFHPRSRRSWTIFAGPDCPSGFC